MKMRGLKLLCISCAGVLMVLTSVGETASRSWTVLDRVQNVDDPELADLIHAAIESRKKGGRTPGERETLEFVRKVTLSYGQIKLLDQQIEQLLARIGSETGPADTRYDLRLAKAELESKLLTEMTNLRDMMGIIPRYPFDPMPYEVLKTRLQLNPIGDRIYVLALRNPSMREWARRRFESLGLMSEAQAMDLIRERLKDPENLPIRIDVIRWDQAAEDLHGRVVDVVSKAGRGLQAMVHLRRELWFIGRGEAHFYVRDGKVLTLYPAPVQVPDGPPDTFLASGFVDMDELEQHILWRLTFGFNVPFTFQIEHDQASSDLAKRVAGEARRIVKRLGLSEVVGVNSTLVEPVPIEAFLGRWEAVVDGEMRAITFEPGGTCQVIGGSTAPSIKDGESLTLLWVPTTSGAFIDPKRYHPSTRQRYTYLGHIDKDGNLVVYRGVIWPQGNFNVQNTVTTVFRKVE